jgi:hypothetical protein
MVPECAGESYPNFDDLGEHLCSAREVQISGMMVESVELYAS